MSIRQQMQCARQRAAISATCLSKGVALTGHPAVKHLCRAPDQALVVLSDDALRHGPVDIAELVAAARVLRGGKGLGSIAQECQCT